jgi:hypothetical protein
MTMTFDMSRLENAIRRYRGAAVKETSEVVRSAARNFIIKAIGVTPPSVNGKADGTAKKRGEAVIQNDLDHIFLGLDPESYRQFLARGGRDVRRELYRKDGTIYVTDTDIEIGSPKDWHQQNRRENGRVHRIGRKTRDIGRHKNWDRGVLLASEKKAYIARVLKKVGTLAAGWNASAIKLQATRYPAWIKHRGHANGQCLVEETPRGIRIRMENMVGFATKVRGLDRRIKWAINAQAGALERAADAIMAKTARRAGFR